MVEQCRLHNKTLIFKSATNKLFKLQKGIINNFVEHCIKDGVDGILVKEEYSESYIETIKIFNRTIIEMELLDKRLNEELSKFYQINRTKQFFLFESIIDAAVKMTYRTRINLIVLLTDDIEISKLVSKYRPNCFVVVPTANEENIKFMRFIRGVCGIFSESLIFEDIIKNPIFRCPEKVLVLNLFKTRCSIRNGYYIKDI
jgi:pyruvate kinase